MRSAVEIRIEVNPSASTVHPLPIVGGTKKLVFRAIGGKGRDMGRQTTNVRVLTKKDFSACMAESHG
jgi:hypothetical protein